MTTTPSLVTVKVAPSSIPQVFTLRERGPRGVTGASGAAAMFPYLKSTIGAVSPAIQAAFDADAINIGDVVHTGSYHEGSDLGGCTYRVVASATGADDGGSFIDFTGFQLKALFGDRVLLSQFGAKPEFGADATAALNAALAAFDNVPSIKPVVIDGRYKVDTAIVFTGLAFPHLVGHGSGDLRTSVLRYTGATGIGFDFRQLSRFNIDGIGFEYSHASYDGILCDFSGVSSDTSAVKVSRCWFSSDDLVEATAHALVRLDSCHSIRFTDCEFWAADHLILGQEDDSITGFPYSNGIQFSGCRFHRYNEAICLGAGDAWNFDSCTVEASAITGQGRFIVIPEGFKANGVSVTNCWIGDQTDPDPDVAWVEYRGYAFHATGNWVGVHLSSFFRAMEAVEGVNIVGNMFGGSPDSSIADFDQSEADGSLDSISVNIVGNGMTKQTVSGQLHYPRVFRNSVPPSASAVWQDETTGELRVGPSSRAFAADQTPTMTAVEIEVPACEAAASVTVTEHGLSIVTDAVLVDQATGRPEPADWWQADAAADGDVLIDFASAIDTGDFKVRLSGAMDLSLAGRRPIAYATLAEYMAELGIEHWYDTKDVELGSETSLPNRLDGAESMALSGTNWAKLPHDGQDYVYLPGTSGNSITVARPYATTHWTVTFTDDTTQTGTTTADPVVIGDATVTGNVKTIVLRETDGAGTIGATFNGADITTANYATVTSGGQTWTVNRTTAAPRAHLVTAPIILPNSTNNYGQLPSTQKPSFTKTTGAFTVLLAGVWYSDTYKAWYSAEASPTSTNDGLELRSNGTGNGMQAVVGDGATSVFASSTGAVAAGEHVVFAAVVEDGFVRCWRNGGGFSSPTALSSLAGSIDFGTGPRLAGVTWGLGAGQTNPTRALASGPVALTDSQLAALASQVLAGAYT